MQSTSVLLRPPLTSASTASPSDILHAVSRQISYVQRELQQLLDAQSVGLLSGLGKELIHSHSPSSQQSSKLSIRTPNRSPPASSAQVRKREKSRSSIPLNTARSSIHKALIQLSRLKASESSALAVQQESLSTFLSSLNSLTTKKRGIEGAIRGIEDENPNNAATGDSEAMGLEPSCNATSTGLANEEARLSSEIHSLETRLYELKARLTHIRRLQQERENRLAARLSSWNGALAGVNKAIQREVLEGRGLEDLYPSLRNSGRRRKDGQGVWALPRERRTVELVKEDVEGKIGELLEKKGGVEREEKACVDGAAVWKDALRYIEAVEQRMKSEMESPGHNAKGKENDASVNVSNGVEVGMAGVLDLMNQTIGKLEENATIAEEQRWNLLVCAVGAELEALKQGRDMLLHAVNGAGGLLDGPEEPESSMMTARSRFSDSTQKVQGDKSATEREQTGTFIKGNGTHPLVDIPTSDQRENNDGAPPVEMRPFREQAEIPHDEDDDDEPGPDFLIEHA